MRDSIRVLLVDDHTVVREGLRSMLASDQGIAVVGEAASGEEGIEKVEELSPDVVLMDIRMPGISGIEATKEIKEKAPITSVIMLTMYDSEMYVIEAIRAGAAGYLTKDSSRELLCHAVRAVLDGGTLVRSGLLRQAMLGLVTMPRDKSSDGGESLLDNFTPRELNVLRLLSLGHGNKAIGAELDLAEVTIKKHVQSIIGKLGVSDRIHAAVVGARLGLEIDLSLDGSSHSI